MKKNQPTLISIIIFVSIIIGTISFAGQSKTAPCSSFGGALPDYPVIRNADYTNTSQLQEFFDDLINQQIVNQKIPGATLSVVNSTHVLYQQGYGYANIENNQLVDPGTSMFRAASISKLFTWTAAMQLYEQGLLDLNADINTYLTNFTIPKKFNKPITMLHLMSHTAGFDQPVYRRNIPWTIADIPSLEAALIKYMPGICQKQ